MKSIIQYLLSVFNNYFHIEERLMSEYIIYKGRMVLRLPDEFEIMNAEEAKSIYGNNLFDYSVADISRSLM